MSEDRFKFRIWEINNKKMIYQYEDRLDKFFNKLSFPLHWGNLMQCKFAIIYVYFTKEFDCVEVDNVKSLGDEPICLDSNFLVYALQRIGIDKLHLILEVE